MQNRIPLLQFFFIGLLPSPFKKIIYKLLGFKIRKGVKLSLGSIILAKHCEIKENVNIGFFSIIKAKKICIGSNSVIRSFTFIDTPIVEIDSGVVISEFSVIRAGHVSKMSRIKIMNRVHIFSNVYIDTSYPVIIGEETAIGFNSYLYTHSSYKNILDGYKVSYGNIVIGNKVELTHNVFISPGIVIEDEVIVAYGSFVNKNLPYGVLAAGIPAEIKRKKEQFAPIPSHSERIKILKMIIKNFCEYLVFINFINDYQSDENVWKFLYRRKLYSIFLNPDPLEKLSKHNIVLYLKDYNYKNNLILNKSLIYFNLNSYICSISNNIIFVQMKRFLSRYGIRFDENIE